MPGRSLIVVAIIALSNLAASVATTRSTTAPATTTASGAKLVGDGWTVIFRSDDPAIWNSAAGEPSADNSFAIPLDQTPADMRFLRLTRMDTHESVIAHMTREEFGKPSMLDGDVQWRPATPPKGTEPTNNRSLMGFVRRSWPAEQNNEHLIVFSRNWKGYRGWGFSKRVGRDDAQTYSWAGNPIKKTIFEVAVKSSDLTDDERKLLITDESAIARRKKDTKAIARRQTSIHGLTVSFTDTGAMLGGTTDLILTAAPGPARADTPVTFVTPVGEQMKLVLDDVLRSVRLKYPLWEASKVEFTFDDRTSKMEGASIGAACGTMLLSMLEGFEIDPSLAMTGDVTADGKVRKIGGVAAKIRAATNSNCGIVALPADNYDQVADAMVYEGAPLLSRIQVIGVGTLDDAAAVARVDRADKLKRAIELFAEVQTALKKSPDQIRTRPVREKLGEVLELAPNHSLRQAALARRHRKTAPPPLQRRDALLHGRRDERREAGAARPHRGDRSPEDSAGRNHRRHQDARPPSPHRRPADDPAGRCLSRVHQSRRRRPGRCDHAPAAQGPHQGGRRRRDEGQGEPRHDGKDAARRSLTRPPKISPNPQNR